MFGLSFGEILLLVIVGLIVVGPRKLPTLMRGAGHWIGKLRRMSSELRAQSGIDDLIRQEGLERGIEELRSLSRVNVVDSLITPAAAAPLAASASVLRRRRPPLREREYPLLGCDAGGALPDDAPVYPPPSLGEPSASKPGGGGRPGDIS